MGLTLATLGSHFGPSGRHPEPFQRHGLILELFTLTLRRRWAPFWLPLAAFGLPWDSLWDPLAFILGVQLST